MPTNFYKSPYKIVILSLLISAFIISNAYFVSVYRSYSTYSLLWIWASKSIINQYQFFYVGFLLNLLLLSGIIFFLLRKLERFHHHFLKGFWLICGLLLVNILWVNQGFFIFDTQVKPLLTIPVQPQAKAPHPYYTQVFCRYFTVGSDNYLASGGCDVPD